MERLILKKLIVISATENTSREIEFTRGLNIVIGENKTGKSSLIKSIFHTFGCTVKFEKEWKDLKNSYLLYFQYASNTFCILREANHYSLFEINKNENTPKLLLATDSFNTYSSKLMNILGVSMDCLTNDGQIISATPPLLFRMQYIDQDQGWDKIGESFSNIKYIKDWKTNTNKYIVGFQDEEFYKLKKEKELIKREIDNYNIKISHYKEFIKNLTYAINELDIPEDFIDKTNALIQFTDDEKLNSTLLKKLNSLEREKLKLKEMLSKYHNEKYEKNLELNFIKKNIKNLEADHQYAIFEDEEIKCPFCGVIHNNNIENRIEIIKDIQTGNKLIQTIRKDITELDSYIQATSSRKREITVRCKAIKKYIAKIEHNASIIRNYKNEGKLEIINSSLQKKNDVVELREKKIMGKQKIEDNLKELSSKANDKRKIIRTKLIAFCEKVYSILNIPLSDIKLNDFVQVLNKTGSENSRMIYAYHISLYLYNIDRKANLFNFLVVDTPNQQGQSKRNLKNIDSVLSLLLSNEGQVILGTERETNFEKQANNVITLLEEKKCLNKTKFQEHIELLNLLKNYQENIEVLNLLNNFIE